MPTATANRHRDARALGVAFAIATYAAAGCSPATNAAGDDAAIDDTGNCVIGTSRGPGSAIPLGAMPASGQICPRGDQDWYAIDVPQGADLLDLTVGYPTGITRVAILAQLFAADGKTPIADGEIADTRTGARKGTVGSTLRIPQPGHYLIVVRDSDNTQSDSLNSYVLAVASAKDPDTHEPNDDPAHARPADAAPGWLAYRGDHDLFTVNVPQNDVLLDIQLTNPLASQTVLHYALEDATGKSILGEGDVPPSMMPLDALRLLASNAGGNYIVAISAPAGAPTDRRPASGYQIALTARPELDPNDQGARNDSGATATCLGGPMMGGGCSGAYMGAEIAWSKQGEIGSLGDRDYFRFDVGAGAPALVEAGAQLKNKMGATPMQLAIDLLVPHAGSACKADGDCAAINQACKADTDCELSHSCLPAAAYAFCPNGAPCRLCAGAAACVPLDKPGGKTVCAAPQYLVHDKSGAYAVRTSQPLFSTGPYYIVVHDFQDDAFDYGNDYTLDVRAFPEPDPGDLGATPAQRNNFYNPYPMQGDDLRPSQARARDITDDLIAGRPISGVISYASDEDWFSFRHPCPKMDCGLVFEWTQPGPSAVRVALLMRRDDLAIHESWTYTGQVPTAALPGPVTVTFGESDCHECSFASRAYNGKSYWLQVRDVGSSHWDAIGTYSFRLKTLSSGCPPQCSELSTPMNPVCGCYCAALMKCPPGPPL